MQNKIYFLSEMSQKNSFVWYVVRFVSEKKKPVSYVCICFRKPWQYEGLHLETVIISQITYTFTVNS
jgi:hypothetical protein